MQITRTILFGALLGLVPAVHSQAPGDAQIQSEVQHALGNKHFSGVHADVQNGIVTLTGSVEYYSDKEQADRRVHHIHDVRAVRNMIEVAGGGENVDDETLHRKLAEKLTYDRVGYGTTPFNNIELGVHNGVVTLRGTVYGPADKDSALSLVANTKGVRDVIDELEVAPVSPMDDRIRMEEARAIYGYGPLQRYALDPAKTIRITVVNGHVTLNGVVDSKGDRDMAGIRANGVPGVFSVTNNLQVAGQSPNR